MDHGGRGGIDRPQRLGRHAGRQRIAQRSTDVVGSLADGFDNHIQRAVDHIRIVAAQTLQHVGIASAVDDVVACVADHGVGEVVAGQVDGRRSGGIGGTQGLHRHVHAQRVRRRYVRIVGALAGGLDDGVSHNVDEEGIIAGEAAQGISAAIAVEDVVGGVAFKGIGEFVASEVDHRRGTAAEGREQLHLLSGAEGIADRRARTVVGALARGFHDHVAGVVDGEEVVAGAAIHGVGAAASVQRVIAAAAEQRIPVDVADESDGGGVEDGLPEVADTGNNLANIVTGNAGNNILNAGAGNDTLNGGLGIDTLIGNLGKDTSTGGGGNDIFRHLATTHSPVGAGADVILDFDDSNDDRIDVSALFGPAMIYRHNLAFTAAGQVRINDVAGADVIVEVNTGGTLAADMQIRLTNTTLASMTGSDFLL